MPGTLLSQIGGTCRLSARTTDAILARAMMECARVNISVNRDGVEVDQPGTIIGERGPDLTIELDAFDPAARVVLGASSLRVNLEVNGASYMFETELAAGFAGAEPGVIHLRKPVTITLVDRRRSPRRRLREPAEVLLRATDVNDAWQCKAMMLNLSLDGVACRISEASAGPLHTGRTIRVMLRLDASSPAFELNGEVINITQGGTPNHLVVGLEFVADEQLKASRTRLREALETAVGNGESR